MSTICNSNTLDNIDKTLLLKTWKDNGDSKCKKTSAVFSNLTGVGVNGMVFWGPNVCILCD